MSSPCHRTNIAYWSWRTPLFGSTYCPPTVHPGKYAPFRHCGSLIETNVEPVAVPILITRKDALANLYGQYNFALMINPSKSEDINVAEWPATENRSFADLDVRR